MGHPNVKQVSCVKADCCYSILLSLYHKQGGKVNQEEPKLNCRILMQKNRHLRLLESACITMAVVYRIDDIDFYAIFGDFHIHCLQSSLKAVVFSIDCIIF